MCGVIGLVYEKSKSDLGRVAAELLKTLEYRGYDSTGAAIQGDTDDVTLAKGVGAPSLMVDELGITRMSGRAFCGQVRWATFGAVTKENSQPHVVRCKTFLYGAHNGNVTNCDDLKAWLTSEGHNVLSDNDGEMVVHTIEHFFARELDKSTDKSHDARRRCMRAALLVAAQKLEGSFAAVIVDPISRVMWAIKQGSSLYFGIGTSADEGGKFAIASSDLSSVLKLTRVVIPITEGEFIEYTPDAHRIYSIEDRTVKTATGAVKQKAGEPIEREPVRSRLRAKDTALVPPFETFMDQEISAQEQTARDVITVFLGGSDAARALAGTSLAKDVPELATRLDALRDQYDDARIRSLFHELVDMPRFREVLARVPNAIVQAETLHSSEAGFFADLLPMARDKADVTAVRLLDAMLEVDEVRENAEAFDRFGRMCAEAIDARGRIYVICCGSSYHAAKAASLFFNELAGVELTPILPGEFRGQSSRSLEDGDLVIAVSQSGETKDLIDVLNDVIASGKKVGRIGLVNNVNSTLAQEKSDLVIPLRCGPEIAVPATKSFMNQMVVFYCLALHLAERRGKGDPKAVQVRRDKLRSLPELVRETVSATDADIEVAAKLLYLSPSIHLLATRISAVAKEGALKIREVVLNHTEGFEASEFKHGPNTILGFNTVLGPARVDAMLKRLGVALRNIVTRAGEAGLGPESVQRLIQAATDAVLSPTSTPFSLDAEERAVFERAFDRNELVAELYADYPLVYVTGPDERDVALTVSQINTHKIRGACTVVVAEDHPALRGAAQKAPIDNESYRSVYISLPRTGDTLMAAFSSTVALQRLALRMSLLKKHYLDRLGIAEHGVHPDVPKNVSKSITVD
ncbi:MAG: SIS domain-containing protein [Deltaproteobacteria bacterium]|nr:SIS domain-containing protein [Deltaproteobacteria bacterium]